jgi:hypothetical protein
MYEGPWYLFYVRSFDPRKSDSSLRRKLSLLKSVLITLWQVKRLGISQVSLISNIFDWFIVNWIFGLQSLSRETCPNLLSVDPQSNSESCHF